MVNLPITYSLIAVNVKCKLNNNGNFKQYNLFTKWHNEANNSQEQLRKVQLKINITIIKYTNRLTANINNNNKKPISKEKNSDALTVNESVREI